MVRRRFSFAFCNVLNDGRTDVSARLDKLKDQPNPSSEDVALLVQHVAKLRKELVDATAYLPSYDQRQYEQVCFL